ncbi:hypothetical protein TCON_0105 [Astathelohania contejeani]|uniref:Uncharacterized protein n=1 Tax=Astathelohania contejeani TaxID=164912 RepID=A0ABQ7I2T6_9MICR|nr:hypothetical protein TCON_0105 [Thelohania contejeani]
MTINNLLQWLIIVTLTRLSYNGLYFSGFNQAFTYISSHNLRYAPRGLYEYDRIIIPNKESDTFMVEGSEAYYGQKLDKIDATTSEFFKIINSLLYKPFRIRISSNNKLVYLYGNHPAIYPIKVFFLKKDFFEERNSKFINDGFGRIVKEKDEYYLYEELIEIDKGIIVPKDTTDFSTLNALLSFIFYDFFDQYVFLIYKNCIIGLFEKREYLIFPIGEDVYTNIIKIPTFNKYAPCHEPIVIFLSTGTFYFSSRNMTGHIKMVILDYKKMDYSTFLGTIVDRKIDPVVLEEFKKLDFSQAISKIEWPGVPGMLDRVLNVLESEHTYIIPENQ